MPRVLARIGDILRIPLGDGRYGYAQYVYNHSLYSTLLRVLDVIANTPEPPPEIMTAGDLFPPVFVGLNPPIREKAWTIVAHVPVKDFRFPLFKCRQVVDEVPGKHYDWLIWDGETYERVGELPAKYRSLGFLASFGYGIIEARIATGDNKPFDQMT
ncbi:MAG: hypothetical protein H7039_06520 [Bryobacteraceae bacterium]|nr:hypothetical protein [Bryobacteraceae bacterium]